MKMVFKKIISFILLLCFTFCTVSVFAFNSQSLIKKNQCLSPLKTKTTDFSMYAELEEEDDDSDTDTDITFTNLFFESISRSHDFILMHQLNENHYLKSQTTLPIYISLHVFRL